MTIEAKRYDIARIEDSGSVMLDINDMMNLQKRFFFVIYQPAMLADVIVTQQYRLAKLGVSLVAAFASRLVSIFFCKSNKVEISTEPVGMLSFIKIPMILAAFSLAINGLIGFFAKSGVPNRSARQLRFFAAWMMSALVVGNSEATSFGLGAINGEGNKSFTAPAFAYDFSASRLCLGNCHDFSFTGERIAYSGKNEKSVNCWKPLTITTRAISSQAPQECGEGSTTRAWSPERTVKPHECTPRKGRYSLGCMETCRSAGLNASAITKRPYSGKLEALSKFEVRKPVMQALTNDAKKVFDRAAYAQFYQTPLRVVAAGGTSSNTVTLTTNGTATLTNSIAFSNLHAKAIVDTMKERNIPPYVGDDYMAIAWPTTLRGLKNSLETLHQYTESGIKLIFNAEIGRYENVRYTEQTNVSKGITSTGSSGTAWAATGASDWIFFFGQDTVMEGVAIPEEMRAKIPTDYGRSKGVAYYAIEGFGIVHTNATQARIVMWDSAG